VRSRLERKPIVVVSALAGVTNALSPRRTGVERTSHRRRRSVETIRSRHLEQAEKCLARVRSARALRRIGAMCDELATGRKRFCHSATPRAQHGHGRVVREQLSSIYVLRRHCERLPAVHVDARRVMITDDNFTRAEPQPDAIAEATARSSCPR